MNTSRWSVRGLVIIGIAGAVLLGILLNPAIRRRIYAGFLQRMPVALPGLPPCPDCNIIVVSLDTLGADHLPCYGYERDTAPNLCRFAEKNILFSRFYSESPFTLDSHMSIFTGLFPSTHHMLVRYRDTLNTHIPTLTQVLKKNGYKTIYAGVTNDATLPLTKGLERGFDEIHAIPTRGQGWEDAYRSILPKLSGTKPSFFFLHTYWAHLPYLAGTGPRLYPSGAIPGLPVTDDQFYAASPVFYRFAADALRTDSEQLSFDNLVIRPGEYRDVANALDSAVREKDPVGMKRAIDKTNTYSLYMRWYLHFIDENNPEHMAYMRALYDEQIHALDAALVPLFEFAERPDQKRKTILIITADHGEEFMEHGAFGHNHNIFDTTTHVPFVAAIPRVRSGTYADLAQSIDIYPTLLALTGVPSPSGVEGKNLLPLLSGSPHASGSYVISELNGDKMQSIRNNEWKFFRIKDAPGGVVRDKALYHTSEDPSETQNVISGFPKIAAMLEAELDRKLAASPGYEALPAELPAWMSPADRQKLIDRGYF